MDPLPVRNQNLKANLKYVFQSRLLLLIYSNLFNSSHFLLKTLCFIKSIEFTQALQSTDSKFCTKSQKKNSGHNTDSELKFSQFRNLLNLTQERKEFNQIPHNQTLRHRTSVLR